MTATALMNILSFHQDLPLIGPYEPDQVFEQYALPCTTTSNDRQNFATPDIQAQTLQHLLTTKTFIESMDLDERHLSHYSSTELRK